MASPLIGVDVGGSKVLAVLLDGDRPDELLASDRADTPRGTGPLLDVIAGQIAVVAPAGPAPPPVGVGMPGLVDRDGKLRFGPNLPGVFDVPFQAELEARLGTRVVVVNDASAAALAETRVGAARGHTEVVLVTLGTGIGAGLVTGGRLNVGANGFAGEAGHMVVDPNGPPCPCGRRGCWERYASGSGLGRLGRDAALAGHNAAAVELAGGEAEAVRGEHVIAAARAGDRDALAVVRDFSWWLGLGLANLAAVLDPEIMVVGGGVIESQELFLPSARDHFTSLLMAAAHRPDIPVVGAALGGEAGAIGAALAVADGAAAPVE